MSGSDIQERYVLMLMEKVQRDLFPSADHMNPIEGALANRQQLEAYAELLLEKVEPLRFPSLAMLDRLQRLVTMLPR